MGEKEKVDTFHKSVKSNSWLKMRVDVNVVYDEQGRSTVRASLVTLILPKDDIKCTSFCKVLDHSHYNRKVNLKL